MTENNTEKQTYKENYDVELEEHIDEHVDELIGEVNDAELDEQIDKSLEEVGEPIDENYWEIVNSTDFKTRLEHYRTFLKTENGKNMGDKGRDISIWGIEMCNNHPEYAEDNPQFYSKIFSDMTDEEQKMFEFRKIVDNLYAITHEIKIINKKRTIICRPLPVTINKRELKISDIKDELDKIFVGFYPIKDSIPDENGKTKKEIDFDTWKAFKPLIANGENAWRKNEQNLLTIDEALQTNGFSGVLKEGYIVLDADTKEDAEMLIRVVEYNKLDCIIIRTNKGVHAYFESNSAMKNVKSCVAKYNYLNICLDYKGNGAGDVALKQNGKERMVLRHGKIEKIPFYLEYASDNLIQSKSHPDERFDFPYILDSEYKHDIFLHYVAVLSSKFNLTDSKLKTIIYAINGCLDKPSERKKLDAEIFNKNSMDNLRKMKNLKSKNIVYLNGQNNDEEEIDEEYLTFYDSRGHLLHENFMIYFLKKEGDNIINVGSVSEPQFYTKQADNMYVFDDKAIFRKISTYLHNLKSSDERQLYDNLSTKDSVSKMVKMKKLSPARYIPFKSKILDLEKNELIDYTSDYIFTHKIPWDYNAQAEPTQAVDDWLNKLSAYNQTRRAGLEEIMGYPMYRDSSSEFMDRCKIVLLNGNARGGKSKFMEAIKILIAGHEEKNQNEVISTLALNRLTDRFEVHHIQDKWVNIAQDISNSSVPNPEALKSIISGEGITGEIKGKESVQFTPFCKLIFGCNSVPIINDENNGISSRLIVVNFKNTFLPADSKEREMYPNAELTNPHLIRDLFYKQDENGNLVDNVENIQYMLKLAIEGLQRLRLNQNFTLAEEDEFDLKEISLDNNVVTEWLHTITNSYKLEVWQKYLCDCGRTINNAYDEFLLHRKKVGYRDVVTFKAFSNQLHKEAQVESERYRVKTAVEKAGGSIMLGKSDEGHDRINLLVRKSDLEKKSE